MPYTNVKDDCHTPLRYTHDEWNEMIDKFMNNQYRVIEEPGNIKDFIKDETGDYVAGPDTSDGSDQEVIIKIYDDGGQRVRFWTTDYAVMFYTYLDHNWGKGVDVDRIETIFMARNPQPRQGQNPTCIITM